MRVVLNPTITRFEKALLDALLDGPLDILGLLRAQVRTARTVSRELSGVGFFLNFEVPAAIPRVMPPNFEISDVYFDLEGAEHGGGAILFVREGVITMLEAYAHAENWPDDTGDFMIRYFDGAVRSMAKVEAEILSRSRPDRRGTPGPA